MEGSSHDLGLSVTERTSAWYELSGECKPGRPACVLSYRCLNKVGSAFIVSELKPLPPPGCFCCSVAKSCPFLYDPMDCSQASLSFIISWSLFRLMSIESVHPISLTGEMVYSIIVIKRAASGVYQSRSQTQIHFWFLCARGDLFYLSKQQYLHQQNNIKS